MMLVQLRAGSGRGHLLLLLAGTLQVVVQLHQLLLLWGRLLREGPQLLLLPARCRRRHLHHGSLRHSPHNLDLLRQTALLDHCRHLYQHWLLLLLLLRLVLLQLLGLLLHLACWLLRKLNEVVYLLKDHLLLGAPLLLGLLGLFSRRGRQQHALLLLRLLRWLRLVLLQVSQ